ncbi:MAG: hypothetical protein Ct9H90mP2_09020 [Dehalococcoidia bacterium]|nr:MAG: hypothetical protein Ct9H90mP2_09020 [Dehalococcoidia bacterium]
MTINNQSFLGPGYDVKGNEMRYRDAFNNTLRAGKWNTIKMY